MKKVLSLLLVGIIAVTGWIVPISASGTASITYAFSGADSAKAGYAQGTVTLNAPNGSYLLYWADDSEILSGYYEIAEVKVSSGHGSYTFKERVAIPAGATSLVAVAKNTQASWNNAAAIFKIPQYKRLPYSENDRQYRCEALSDIHIDCEGGKDDQDDVNYLVGYVTPAATNTAPSDTITVYFSDALNWGGANVYYWNDGPAWPGTAMTAYRVNEYGQQVYKATIPANANGVIFNYNGAKTVNITTGITDGAWWYTLDEKEPYYSYSHYTASLKNFRTALSVADKHDADFIITAGDNITNAGGATLEWLEYQKTIATSAFDGPVYEAIGNHEMRYTDLTNAPVNCSLEAYIIATGLDDTAAAMSSRKPYFEVTQPTSGDHFIFMALEKSHTASQYDEFSTEQITWLENLLRAYNGDGHRIFLIQHALINRYGAGDDHDNPGYGGGLEATSDFPNNLRFKQLLEQYRDVIWLSGHTHIDFRDDVNFSDENGNSCLMFHIPSTASTTRLAYKDNGERTLDRVGDGGDTDNGRFASQGYLIDAYSGAVLLKGVNLHEDMIYPAYTYIVGDASADVQPTEPEPEEPTQAPQPALMYGDADDDGDITVLDVTYIQRYDVDIPLPSPLNELNADVDGDGFVTIVDATFIQRWISGIIAEFPVEEGIAATGASDTATVVKHQLDYCYQYASYAEYAALKRAYNSGNVSQMQTALTAFRSLKTRVKPTTVYFRDNRNLETVYAYVWKNSSGKKIAAWPGYKATFMEKTTTGRKIYAVTIDRAIYDYIIFHNDDDKKTVNISLSDQSGMLYYPSSDNSPYQVSSSVQEQLCCNE